MSRYSTMDRVQITYNPPYSCKDAVLKRAYGFNKPFALLMPINNIQGKNRYKIWGNDIQVLCFDGRVCYHTRGDMHNFRNEVHFGSAYFCRELLPTKLEMRQLIKYERPLIAQ